MAKGDPVNYRAGSVYASVYSVLEDVASFDVIKSILEEYAFASKEVGIKGVDYLLPFEFSVIQARNFSDHTMLYVETHLKELPPAIDIMLRVLNVRTETNIHSISLEGRMKEIIHCKVDLNKVLNLGVLAKLS